MKTIPYLLLVVLHISTLSEANNSPPSPCGLPKDLGPCRFTEPCMPTLFSWNESYIIVSWEGLFEGCHEDQINHMRIKIKEGQNFEFEKTTFSKNEAYLEKKLCKNSSIALSIYFNEEDNVIFPNDERNLETQFNPQQREVNTYFLKTQQRDLHTHYNHCTNIISRKTNDEIILVISISAGILLIVILIILLIVLKKKCCKMGKRNADMDVDLSPVYGDYYYQDGERRQNVVEVNIIAGF